MKKSDLRTKMTDQEQRVWDGAFGAYCATVRAPHTRGAYVAAERAVALLRHLLASTNTEVADE